MCRMKNLIALLVFTFLSACGGSSDEISNPSEGESMNNMQDTNSGVMLTATLRSWDSRVLIDYTITNNGPLELIVFDVGFVTTTGVDDDGLVTLYQAKRDTGTTDFESAPTIAGRNLSPDQTLTGSADHLVPISIDFGEPSESVNPDKVRFCVGYGSADDIIPTTNTDGTFSLNEGLELQSLTCSIVERT